MAFIDPIADEAVSGVAAELFQADRARLGYVSNYTRVFARRPGSSRHGDSLSALWRRTWTIAATSSPRLPQPAGCVLATAPSQRRLRQPGA